MPWKENEDGTLARGEDKNPIWINDAGMETSADYVGLTKRLSEVNAESKSRKEKLRELEARIAPLTEAGIEDIAAYLAEARDAIEMKKNAPDKDKALEEQVKARLEPIRQQVAARDKLLEEERKKTADVTAQYHAVLVKSEVLNSSLLKDRVVPEVRPFLERELARAGAVEGEKVIFRDARGEIIYGDKGDPAGVDEAAVALIRSLGLEPAKMLLSTSKNTGSDATTGIVFRGGHIKNPWAKDSWNLTAQMEIYHNNPTEARRLMQAAGAPIPAGL